MPDAKDQKPTPPAGQPGLAGPPRPGRRGEAGEPLPSTEPPRPLPQGAKAGAKHPAQTLTPPAPEIEMGEGEGDEIDDEATLGALEGEALAEAARRQQMRSCAAMELKTFVVPEVVLPLDASPDDRAVFVEERLARRLPCPVSHVRRVDVHLFEPGAVLVRVWFKID